MVALAKFDPLGLLRGLRSTLAWSEGYLDSAHLYLNPTGADQYAQIIHEQSYQIATRQPCPIDSATETVKPRLGKRFDCILLGSGEGTLESRFLRMLPAPGAVIAVDISQALLSAAYTRLVDDLPSSKVFALQGDITNMREHRQFTYRGNVVVTLFGKTFTNLPDGFDFLDAMGVFQPGTLLVLDLSLARGSTRSARRTKRSSAASPSYHDLLAGRSPATCRATAPRTSATP